MKIIFEDKNYIVCLKPAGIPVQSDITGDLDLHTEAVEYMKTKGFETPYIGLVHRIDRPVSGIVVFAKNPKTAADISKQLQDRSFKKSYLAVVEGRPESNTLENYLKKKFKGNISSVVDSTVPKAKKAILHFKTLETIQHEDKELSLIEVQLETGRHHQIRVQLSHAGYPIWGDTKYNPNFQQEKGWFQIALFAYSITFKDALKKSVDFKEKPTDHPFTLFDLERL